MTTKVLIMAAGNATRWRNHEGVPKHLVNIEGEILVHRTARQFAERGCCVVIIGADERYRYPGAELYIPRDDERQVELDKFLVGKHLWGPDRTILAFGDVYFTDEAIDSIVNDESRFRFYLRQQGSKLTGKLAKEMFAVSFTDETKHRLFSVVEKLKEEGRVTKAGGWSVFRQIVTGTTIIGGGNYIFKDPELFVDIDDWTEDFDFPRDLDTWRANRERWLTENQ